MVQARLRELAHVLYLMSLSVQSNLLRHRMLLEREGASADEEFERIQKNWPRDHHKK